MRSPTHRTRIAAIVLVAAALASCSSAGSDTAETTTSVAPVPTTQPTAGGPVAQYADYETVNYDDPAHWVCRPDITDDICDGDLDATLVAPDGTLTVEPFERAEDPAIDCFYVYPTISRDETPFSDWEASDDEEGFVTLNQAARLQSECRLFAPVYRQLTLGALGSRINGNDDEAPEGDPFADVLDAFKTYMAQDNDGRPFVLIGHSQGASMLNQLIAAEVDPNEEVRDKLVGAYLAGGSVAVPEGEVVGGDFQDVPLCTEAGQAHCVITWATFRADAPPPDGSFFGKPRASEGVAGCVNPAAPAGGLADLDGYFPANAEANILGSLGMASEGKSWVDPSAGDITTPFVRITDLVSGECATEGDFNYLAATVQGDPNDPRADDIPGDLSPEWGLHLVDVNLVMGDVVENVRAQAATVANTGD